IRRSSVRSNGSVNPIGLMALIAIAVGIYAVVMAAPAFMDNLDVKEAVAATFNQAARQNDDALRLILRSKVQRIGEHEEDEGYGNFRIVPGLGVKDEDIEIQRDEQANTLMIQLNYTRRIELKPFHQF